MTTTAGKKRRRKVDECKRVALAIVAHEYAHGRGKIKGIIDYYKKHSNWEIHRDELSQPFVLPENLAGWTGDGVICEIYTPQDVAAISALSVPAVNTSSSELAVNFPSVRMDNHEIGCMAAAHLIECKLDNFAFVGPIGLRHARERYEGFSRSLEKSGTRCLLVDYKPRGDHQQHYSEELVAPEKLVDAIASLAKPVGIMASSDRVGFAVLEACRKLGLRSPEDVAVIGVDDDEILCNLAYASMTSIDPQAREVGYTAAAMLHSLMDGKTPEKPHVLIPPARIVLRDSTDVTRSEYPEVARALRFIRNHADRFIDVTNVLDVVPVSRRWLEMKFQEEVGHGIYQEIRRVHVDRAKLLLETTDLPVMQVSRQSGFNNVERFDFAFRKLVGTGASEYRQKALRKKERANKA